MWQRCLHRMSVPPQVSDSNLTLFGPPLVTDTQFSSSISQIAILCTVTSDCMTKCMNAKNIDMVLVCCVSIHAAVVLSSCLTRVKL